MAAFIIYIIRWAVCLTLLYSLFGLFLKRETLHGINRIVLLFVLTSCMVLPFVPLLLPVLSALSVPLPPPVLSALSH